MFLPLPTDAVTLTHARPAPGPVDAAARCSTVPPALAALAEELVETVPVRLTTTSTAPGAATGAARRPVLVARPRTSHEVAQVVRAARAHGVPVAVPTDERRAGAPQDPAADTPQSPAVDTPRDPAGTPNVDPQPDVDLPAGADLPADAGLPADADVQGLDSVVLVSTQGLTAVTVLPVLARAHVGVGARWRDLLAATAHYGLVPLAGLPTGVEPVAAASGRGRPRAALPRVPEDARVTDVLTPHGVRAVSVVTGAGALRRVAPTDRDVLAGSVTTRGARGVVVAVELDLVERPAP
ncbi:FAD linked oxidase domain protein [Cellulomonas flavigena DSM 20109]|uniref:FAD linked oxidase domain protein n=1 Tax=Cellulomonas flavigena (strain ATCC 482 / DSM 20109 / BCRC 11376 / JCM 18109 / NBRC 3775 / NCIMB 8073 / NRS 134) TaxID=446466 RepID=D5UCX6_CELFN|nr:FAD-binding oxidoreductase [Cellulomonas flavigena]ADG76361.1 FAD linked oxidase domain protein [Cellulomonas flavigena DSM 20109]